MDEETEERVQKRAYEIWEEEGRPDGRAAEHWDQACRDLGVQDDTRVPPMSVPAPSV
ncbi:DUF2934 domain-containing protein [Chthonobacter rhizosphaerae]|uniref:DUF2934 domain-containing protein n=1 Tax=Chthonobacter rhizosphaerae TaxID=2735553 RepID=UPI0015EF3381|nr:DUF2934 domain-containing protein [Chthonobacter rhizosphaerae]